MSYVFPYTLISLTVGGTLTYLTEKPVFVIISLPLGIGCGMIRDRNVKNFKESNNVDAAVKGIALYKLGIPLICLGLLGSIALATK